MHSREIALIAIIVIVILLIIFSIKQESFDNSLANTSANDLFKVGPALSNNGVIYHIPNSPSGYDMCVVNSEENIKKFGKALDYLHTHTKLSVPQSKDLIGHNLSGVYVKIEAVGTSLHPIMIKIDNC